MLKVVFCIQCLFFGQVVHAVDATDNIRIDTKIGDWQVVEFALPKGALFRIGSYSTNDPSSNLAIDFMRPKCTAGQIQLVKKFSAYKKYLDEGNLVLAYKVSSFDESMEIVSTEMTKGDQFAFFKFSELSANALLRASQSGQLAIWVPESGDGSVKRSPNIDFSLKGFVFAHNLAKKACEASR